MFDILYDTRRYYLRNQLTGNLITKHGKVAMFRSPEKAAKHVSKMNKEFTKTMRKFK